MALAEIWDSEAAFSVVERLDGCSEGAFRTHLEPCSTLTLKSSWDSIYVARVIGVVRAVPKDHSGKPEFQN